MTRAAAFLAGCVLLAGTAHAAMPADAEVELRLTSQQDEGEAQRRPFVFRLQREKGEWNPFVAVMGRNAAVHEGWVAKSEMEGGRHKLSVQVRFLSDKWAADTGGGRFTLWLSDEPQVSGTWETQLGAAGMRGAVAGTAEAARLVPGFVPPRSGEHPRLLVRKSELPALRERAKTEWGKAWLERLQKNTRSSVAQAMAYAITEDRTYAAAARATIEKSLGDNTWYHVSIAHAGAFVSLENLIAYDLIYEACDDAFRQKMRDFISDKMEFFYWGTHNSQYNGAPTSNWSLMYRSGGGLIALTMLDEPMESPRPMKPAMRAIELPKEAVAESPGSWSMAGPFGEARGERGDMSKMTFAPVTQVTDGTIDLAAAIKRSYLKAYYLRTALKVEKAGHYRLATTRNGKALRYVTAMVGGQAVSPEDVLELKSGTYPLLVRVWPEPMGVWEPLEFSAKLSAVKGEQAEATVNAAVAAWEADEQVWALRKAQREKKQWTPEALHWARASALSAEGYFRRGLGEMGWNQEGEGYTRHALRAGIPFALCYRNTFGREIPGSERLGMTLVLATAATVFGEDAAAMQTFSIGGGPMDVDLFARAWPFVPEKYRPAVLWSWNRSLALAEAGRFKDPHCPVATHDGLSGAMMLMHYPLEMKEKNPVEVLERVTVDRQKGGYVFRNRWKDGDDSVVQIFGNDNQAGGSWVPFDAGTFRIHALGAAFAVRGQGYGNGGSGRSLQDLSLYQNIVDVAESDLAGSQVAKTTAFSPQADGSGVVTFNMDDLYIHGEKAPAVDGKRPDYRVIAKKDLGIRAVRSFGVDYSGACGSPVLVAVADRLTGTKGSNTWQMSTERGHTVTCEGSTFTIAGKNGATLKGTVVLPAGATVRSVEAEHRHEINYHGGHKQAVFQQRVILVDGKDKDQDFLVVMTVQKGEAPAVSAAGASATVGKRVVRFDGKTLSLEGRP